MTSSEPSKYAHNTVNLGDPSTTWSKIARVVPEGADVLDVGCSSGYLAEALIDHHGATVTGIEMSPHDAAEARTRGLAEVLEADIEAFDWNRLGERRFDVIIFADILEHLRDPAAVLRHASGYLKDHGVIAVSVPNIGHISIRSELMEGSFIYTKVGILDNTHTKYFTRPTIEQMIAEAHLNIYAFDATLNDLPDDLIIARLAALGLQATPEFQTQVLDTVGARAFQYVVIAGREQAKQPPDPIKLPPNVAEKYQGLKHRLVETQQKLEAAESERDTLRFHLAQVTGSKKWKLVMALSKVIPRKQK